MTINTPKGPRWLKLASVLILFLVIQISAHENELATSADCYYNYNHYSEGDRILTNEPCLNCTCHNKMLMCYLKVCPFTKPIGQDCTIEKREDQCCPIITCPEVPVELDQSVMQSSTDLASHQPYGCSINGRFYAEGAQIPGNPKKPCELCYCIRNMTSCVMQECTLHVDGCRPIYNKGVCCPVRYDCAHDDEIPMIEDSQTTTEAPSQGFVITTTSAPAQSTECIHNDVRYIDGELIDTDQPCEHCYCMRGDIVCAVQECGKPLEMHGKNCTARLPKKGECCPQVYECAGDVDGTTIYSLDESVATTLGYRDIPEIHADEMITTVRSEVIPSSTEHKAEIAPATVTESDEVITTERIDESENEIHDKDYDHITVKPTRNYTSQQAPASVDNRIEGEESTTLIDKLGEPAATTILADLGAVSEEHLTTLLPAHERITERPSEGAAEKATTEGILNNLYTTIKSIVDMTTFGAIDEGEKEEDGALLSNVIPGEGDCLEDGISYSNSSAVPTQSKCQTSCICLNSIIHCEQTTCPPMPPNAQNCRIVQAVDSCCPSYHCESMEMSTDIAPPQQAESQTIHRDQPIATSTIAGEVEATTQFSEQEKIVESSTLSRAEEAIVPHKDEVQEIKPDIVTESELQAATEKVTELPAFETKTTEKVHEEASTELNLMEEVTEHKAIPAEPILPTEQPIVTEKIAISETTEKLEPEATTIQFKTEKHDEQVTEKQEEQKPIEVVSPEIATEIVTEGVGEEEIKTEQPIAASPEIISEIATERASDELTTQQPIVASPESIPEIVTDRIGEEHLTTQQPFAASSPTASEIATERAGEEQSTTVQSIAEEPQKATTVLPESDEITDAPVHKVIEESAFEPTTQHELIEEEHVTDKKEAEISPSTELPKLDEELSATEKAEIEEIAHTTEKRIELETIQPEIITERPELEQPEAITTEKLPTYPIIGEQVTEKLSEEPSLEQVTTEKRLEEGIESTESVTAKLGEELHPIATELPSVESLTEIPQTETQGPVHDAEIASTEKQSIGEERVTEKLPETSENAIPDSSTVHDLPSEEISTDKQPAIEPEVGTEKLAVQTDLPSIQDESTTATILQKEPSTETPLLEDEIVKATTYRLPAVEEELPKATDKPLEIIKGESFETTLAPLSAEKEAVTEEEILEFDHHFTHIYPASHFTDAPPASVGQDVQQNKVEEPEIQKETEKPIGIRKDVVAAATTETEQKLAQDLTTLAPEIAEVITDAHTPAPIAIDRDESITESYDQKVASSSAPVSTERISESSTEIQTEEAVINEVASDHIPEGATEKQKPETEPVEATTVPASKLDLGGIDSTQFKEGEVISPADKHEIDLNEKLGEDTTQKLDLPASSDGTTTVYMEKSTELPIVPLHGEEEVPTTDILVEKEPSAALTTEKQSSEATTVYSIPSKQEDLEIITDAAIPSKQEDLEIVTEQRIEVATSSEQVTTLASKDIEQPEIVTEAKEYPELTTLAERTEATTPSKILGEEEPLTPTTESKVPIVQEADIESKLPTTLEPISAESPTPEGTTPALIQAEQTTFGVILEKSTERIEIVTEPKDRDSLATTYAPSKLDSLPAVHDEIQPELPEVPEQTITTEAAIQEELATTAKPIESMISGADSENRFGEEQAESTTVKLAELPEIATEPEIVPASETTLQPAHVPTEPSVIDVTTLLNKIHDESIAGAAETTLGSVSEEIITEKAEIVPEIPTEKGQLPEEKPAQSYDVQPEEITNAPISPEYATTEGIVEKIEESEHSTSADELALTTEQSIAAVDKVPLPIEPVSEEKPADIEHLTELAEATTLPPTKIESDSQLHEETTVHTADEKLSELDESTKVNELTTSVPLAPYDAHHVQDVAHEEEQHSTTVAPIVSEQTTYAEKPIPVEPISHVEEPEHTEAEHIEPEIPTTVKSEYEPATTKAAEIESIESQTTESAPMEPVKEISSQESDIATFSPETSSHDIAATTIEPIKSTDSPAIVHDEVPVETPFESSESEIANEQPTTIAPSILDSTTIKTVVDLLTTLHPIEPIVHKEAEITTFQYVDAVTTEKPYDSENASTPAIMLAPLPERGVPGELNATETHLSLPESANKIPLIREPLPNRFDEITTKLAESFDTTTLPSSLLSSHTEQISDSTTVKNTQNEITESVAQHPSEDSSMPVEPSAPSQPEEPEIEHQQPSVPSSYPSSSTYDQPTGGYGNVPSQYTDEEYTDEEEPAVFGPGTCRYGGKLYVSAQQIPRDDPCDFCFCFRSDIICLQQSCPPPISGCHEEPISGFCCPRYECPVSMAVVLNTTTTTTTTLPPYLSHFQRSSSKVTRSGCQIQGVTYKIGDRVTPASGPCIDCICGGDGQMKCDPKVCTPEPMLRQMIAVAASRR